MSDEFHASKPIYLQVVDRIYFSIVRGEIKHGEKLPSVRDMAVQMGDIQANYRSATKSIVQNTIKETGQKINGVYYGIVDNTELQKVQNELKTQLEIE